jgi:hypothetical protein
VVDHDADHRPGRLALAVLRVPAGQQLDRARHLAGAGQDGRAAVGAYPPQQRPVFLVVVGQHRDLRVGPDVAEPLQVTGGFGLAVDHAVDAVALQRESDRDDVRRPGTGDGGQPGHPRRAEPSTRLVGGKPQVVRSFPDSAAVRPPAA